MLVFAIGGLMLLGAIKLGVPGLVSAGFDPLLSWFLAGAFGVFLPLLALGWLLLRQEALPASGLWSSRLRFRPFRATDRATTVRALGVILALTAVATGHGSTTRSAGSSSTSAWAGRWS